MTLDEWTDIVARMTPEQREAMGCAMAAAQEQAALQASMIDATIQECVPTGLRYGRDFAIGFVNEAYLGLERL